MARFERPVPGADVIEDKAGILAWAAREGSRPATTSGAATRSAQAWTLHASAAWSRAHLDETPQAAGDALLEVFRATTGAGAADLVIAHRWLYALVEQPIGRPHLWDAEQAVGVCGDWLLGGRIEAAYDSGLSLADALAGVDAGPA
jgi:predicted NAD/FAD-dependent oxidoreductase